MIGGMDADPVGRLLYAIGRCGTPGRQLAVGLDLVRSTGVRYTWRRIREEAALTRRQAQDQVSPGYAEMWEDAARRLGAEVFPLPSGFLEIRKGWASTRVWNHWVMLDDAVTLRLALDKVLVHRALAAAGLPVPEHVELQFGDLAGAVVFLRRSPLACVVKPVHSSGGSGITSGVRSVPELRRASLRAGRIDTRLVLERQIPGDMYRLLFLDGELLDAVRRLPPRVTGDGRSSVEQLVAAENLRRALTHGERRPSLLRIDYECVLTLERAGLALSSVPAEGVRVLVKTVVSQNSREENENVRDQVSSALEAEASVAAATTGLRLAGVDVATPDPSQGLAAAGGAILEVNGHPGLHYHYDIRDRASASPVAVPILRRLLE